MPGYVQPLRNAVQGPTHGAGLPWVTQGGGDLAIGDDLAPGYPGDYSVDSLEEFTHAYHYTPKRIFWLEGVLPF